MVATIWRRTVAQICQQVEIPADDELLRRFSSHRDEAAFAELVRRHAAMVLGVARRALGDHHAAEDVLQATFCFWPAKPDTSHGAATSVRGCTRPPFVLSEKRLSGSGAIRSRSQRLHSMRCSANRFRQISRCCGGKFVPFSMRNWRNFPNHSERRWSCAICKV